MTQDFSWDVSATRYLSLYRDVAAMPSLPSVTVPTEEALEESARQIAI